MEEECVTFNIGKIGINAKTHQYELNFNEHRKICHEGGIFSFEFGTIIDKKKVLVIGRSIKPEKKLENYEFIVHTYLDGKRIDEKRIGYKDVGDLFTHETNSHLLLDLSRSQHLRSPVVKKKITHQQMRQKPQISQKKQPSQKKQSSQSRQLNEKGKLSFKPGKKEGYVINPETGAEIKIGGPTYTDLCETGGYTC